jgi:Na+/H+ antiporter NhaD/arsenite permease-like protein
MRQVMQLSTYDLPVYSWASPWGTATLIGDPPNILIGASANVVTVGMMEKAGYHISFLHYMRVCFVPMLITVVLAMFYLLGFEMPK